jgi:hypothetical protein
MTTIKKQYTSTERELRLVNLSVIFGTLGASIHGITSLARWLSNKKETKSYFVWYLSLPLVGAGLGLIVYLLIRSTILSGFTSLNATLFINDFGVAGLSAIIGLSTQPITRKLRDVFDEFFGIKKSPDEKGDDPQIEGEGKDNIKLSIENTELEEGKESLLIGIAKNKDGKPIDLQMVFAISDTKVAGFKEQEDPRGQTDLNGIAVKRFQAYKQGDTFATVTATDRELYAKVPLKVKQPSAGTTTPPPGTTTPPPGTTTPPPGTTTPPPGTTTPPPGTTTPPPGTTTPPPKKPPRS